MKPWNRSMKDAIKKVVEAEKIDVSTQTQNIENMKKVQDYAKKTGEYIRKEKG